MVYSDLCMLPCALGVRLRFVEDVHVITDHLATRFD
jgi:hypothetical protein